ncbi:MAG: phenylalanyl-tRNA synthetase, alpha subunit, partial [Solirubrobacterales bacterium]|nr:phenylalanyl-tRNA synthetase, alpha subunit [Solirubrobacterales bacterium]
MLDRIDALRAEAEAQIAAATTSAELEEARVRHLGRKAELPNLLRGVAELAPEERGRVGKAANQARQALEALVDGRLAELEATELDTRLATDRVDVTLPGEPSRPVGRLHLLTQTRREIEDVFVGLGFSVAEGPEIESVHYNFDALNHDPAHPARSRHDTFYVDDTTVLRTHTSPMQVRYMEA